MENRIKSIEIALENETKERDFYLRHAQRTQNPVGKQMFESIAQDEQEHYNRLKQLHEELSKQGKWPEETRLVINHMNIKEVLATVPNLADKSAATDADDIEAVKTAIEFESKAYNFYSKLKDRAETEAERNFFDRLALVEREHMVSLKNTLLFFEDPATWYEEHEKPHFEA